MNLIKKDGSVYQLSSPNIIMTQQNLWEKDQIIIHNKFGKVVIYDKNLKSLYKQENEEIRPVEIPQERPSMVLPEPKKMDTSEIRADSTEIERNKIQVWCLPASLEDKVDTLYGEKYQKIRYGNKFIFEAIMQSQTDFSIVVITSTAEVTENSIIYPKTYDKRWWRVASISKSGNLYTITASLTDYQPRFS